MELTYICSESTEKPVTLEMTVNTVYLRRNIVNELKYNDGGESIVFWKYDEAKLSPSDFNEYVAQISVKAAVEGVDNNEKIISLLSNQENLDNNQLIIMGAIVDLYEAVAIAK